MRNTCRIVVGRLLEIHIAAGYRTLGDIDEMVAMLSATMQTVPPGARIVIAADWRMCNVMTAEVADRVVGMLTGRHMESVERSALLHRADAHTSAMQVFRLVQEAGFKQRKLFTDPREMETWLAEVLDERELRRLGTFLAWGEAAARALAFGASRR